jgi:hypothetical protein
MGERFRGGQDTLAGHRLSLFKSLGQYGDKPTYFHCLSHKAIAEHYWPALDKQDGSGCRKPYRFEGW